MDSATELVLLRWGLAILSAVMLALGGWVLKMSARVAVLEHTLSGLPASLDGIRQELKGMRDDNRTASQELYRHIDDVRKELKDDLKGKADKA